MARKKDKPVNTCPSGDCPNIAHTSCLGINTTFDCYQVSAPRAALGITTLVAFLEDTAVLPLGKTDTPDNESTELLTSEKEDDVEMLQLKPRALVNIIKELSTELQKNIK